MSKTNAHPISSVVRQDDSDQENDIIEESEDSDDAPIVEPTGPLSPLQSSLLDVFKRLFNSSSLTMGPKFAEKPWEISDMTDEQIACIFRYGKRMLNDNWHSRTKPGDWPSAKYPTWFSNWKAKLGITIGLRRGGGGGGGQRLSFEEQATRLILTDFFIAELGQNETVAKKNATHQDRWLFVSKRYTLNNLQQKMTASEITALGQDEILRRARNNISKVQPLYDSDIAAQAAKLRAAATREKSTLKTDALTEELE
jgi:hypothetical protein